MVLDGSILYTAKYGVLTVYDVSDPESPLVLEHCLDCIQDDDEFSDMAVGSDYLIHIGHDAEFAFYGSLVSIADPQNPYLIAGFHIGGYIWGSPVDVHIVNGLLYYCSYNHLRIFEPQPDADPEPVFYGEGFSAVEFLGDDRMVAIDQSSGSYEVCLYDLTNPINPIELSRSAPQVGFLMEAQLLNEFLIILERDELRIAWVDQP